MSLDVYLTENGKEVYWANITHNLGAMAEAAGIYEHLWHPERLGIETARELVEPLAIGLAKLASDPDGFSRYNAENGWGMYEHFVPFVSKYLSACAANKSAKVVTST